MIPSAGGFPTIPPSTPILQRISSSRYPGDEKKLARKTLVPMLQKELKNNVISDSGFIDDLFPLHRLPFPVDDSLLQNLAWAGVWNPDDASFKMKPLSFSEADMAHWLNKLGWYIGEVYGKKRLRVWISGNCNLPPNGSLIHRKPDLVLLDRSNASSVFEMEERTHWISIRAFAEVSSEKTFPKRMQETINEKSYLLFTTQDEHCFALALSFDGSGLFSLTLTDRQGQLQTSALSLFCGKHSVLIFLRILTYLMFGSLTDLGLDPTIVRNPSDGRIEKIYVNNHMYEVVRKIYSLSSLVGRGTKVWIIRMGETHYVLKDSWIQCKHVGSEIEFLQMMAEYSQLKGSIPELVQGQDLVISGEIDKTDRYRKHIGQVNCHRVHRRLVMTPVGSRITHFSSKNEFLMAMICVVNSKFLLCV